jgi:arylsulfatase A
MEQPPDIVLIVAGELGYNELGCYGKKIIKTPAIDRLAEEGRRYTPSQIPGWNFNNRTLR